VLGQKNNLCFGQIKVNEKYNEVTAIPLLLDLLGIKVATIMMSASFIQGLKAETLVQW
jgi:predicted transposase YbfD/YdcC